MGEFSGRFARNGFVLRGPEGEEWVYQGEDDDGEAVKRWAEFLDDLTQAYGPVTSRHSPSRVYIVVRPGDKHPDYRGLDDLRPG